MTAGKTVTNVVQNIDLYPTFVRLGRASIPPSVDGLSLVPLLEPARPLLARCGVDRGSLHSSLLGLENCHSSASCRHAASD